MARVRELSHALIDALDALDGTQPDDGKVACRYFPGERCRCCAVGIDAYMDALDSGARHDRV